MRKNLLKKKQNHINKKKKKKYIKESDEFNVEQKGNKERKIERKRER